MFIFFFALHLRHSEREKEGGRVGGCVVSRRVMIITAIECHIIGMRRPTASTDGDVSRAVHPFIDPNIQTQSGNTADGREKTKNIILYVLFVLSQKRCNISKPAKVP